MLEITKPLDLTEVSALSLRIMHTKDEESILVRKAKGGCQLAYEELEKCNREKVSASLQRSTRNFNVAEEIYQIGIIKGWKKIKKFKGKSRFSTWLHRVCYNLFYDSYRKTKREKSFSLDALLDGSDREGPSNSGETLLHKLKVEQKEQGHDSGYRKIANKELGVDLENTLQRLSQNQRRVLKLYAVDELPYDEIAKKEKIPVGTVMSRLFYARKNARKIFNQIEKDRKKEEVLCKVKQ